MSATRTDSRADLFRALGVLAEEPGPLHTRLAELLGMQAPDGPQWTEAFLVQLVPYASIYLSADGMLGGEPADRVAGFWRALRLPVPSDPDHLTTLLGLYAALVEAEESEPDRDRRALRHQARTALLQEHLLTWLVPYAAAMVDVGPPAYAAWAALLAEAVGAEAASLGAPDRLPVHLRVVPEFPSPHVPDAVVATLFAPARSGLVLTRSHLARIARDTGVGLRRGPRQQVLRALLEQDAAATAAAVADVADAWKQRHRETEPVAGPIATHWAERASATAEVLRAGVGGSGTGEENRI